MNKPVLAVLAAGIGSRYGGLKQIDSIGPNGEIIIDYSIYDAIRAGFEKVAFIITHEIEEDFREKIGNRLRNKVEVMYAYQEISNLPAGYAVPEGRVKPWGTAQALLALKPLLATEPFAVINADDYYGPAAFKTIYQFLHECDPELSHWGMVGYLLENTLTTYGGVTRGICRVDSDGFLADIVEQRGVVRHGGGAKCSNDGGLSWEELPAGTLASMNLWGFTPRLLDCCERDFSLFLAENLNKDPLKCEYLLPTEVGKLIKSGKARVKVMRSTDVWHGITYQDDKPGVSAALRKMHQEGLYPPLSNSQPSAFS